MNSASFGYNNLRFELGHVLGRVLAGRLNGWCKVLLVISFCWLPFALMSCGGGIIIKGTNIGALVASPNSVAFGSVPIGQTASTTVSVLNKSSAPVQIAQLNLSGQPFSLVGSSSLPVTIAAGATHTLNVQFKPAAAGSATGELTVASNSSTADKSVINLSGTGTTGASSAVLSALYCSSGAMTGFGTDTCTLTLTSAAPGDGLTVNLSSSSTAVTVPNTVIVPANATSAQFTATVSSVATAQVVTLTANAGGVMKNATLQLNAAILALSINASSVAFGDVVVNTQATQSVTLISTGTAPVTINGASMVGVSFKLLGTVFPAVLNPGQEETLNIEFNPNTVGTATGQLTINSNSSINGAAVIDMSGTGTAVPLVAVAVTPTIASTTIGTTQQFAASVTGGSDIATIWTVSGEGCNGTVCGTISPNGLYAAPEAIPSSATVTITATSVSDPTKSASATVTITPPQADGYNLAWQDTFSTLSSTTADVPDCNWYTSGIYGWPTSGVISDPSGTYVNLNWDTADGSKTTSLTTVARNGAYFHAWTFGYFEVSMAFSPVKGSWPAIWLVPLYFNQHSTITGPEIDIFEWQSNTPTSGYGTVHTWVNGVDIATNGSSNSWTIPSGSVLSNYNAYGVLWTPTAVSWYFNNVLMETFDTTRSPYNTWFAGQYPEAMALNIAAECNWKYPCPGQVNPLNMQVQWVHIYASPMK